MRGAPIRSQAGAARRAYEGRKGWRPREEHPVAPSLSPFRPRLIPLLAAWAGEGTLRAGPEGSTWPGRAGPGREAKAGQQRGGPGQEAGSASGVRPSLPPGPAAARSSSRSPRLPGGGHAAEERGPRRASCAQLRAAGPGRRLPAPGPAPGARLGEQARRRAREPGPAKPRGRKCLGPDGAGGATHFRPGSPTSSQCAGRFGAEARRSGERHAGAAHGPSAGGGWPRGTRDGPWSGRGVCRPRLSPSSTLQDDHRRAARHLRQHAGRVALPARGSLSLRGRQQSQEAGVKVARSLPQVTVRGCSAQPPESGVARPRLGLQGSKLQIRQGRAKQDTVLSWAPLSAQRRECLAVPCPSPLNCSSLKWGWIS